MKTITLTCDHCKNVIYGDYIMIGSASGTEFLYENTLVNSFGVKTMRKYHDLHFCCETHFVEYFLKTYNQNAK